MLRVQSSAWHREGFSAQMSQSVSGFGVGTWSWDVMERGRRPWIFTAGTLSGRPPGMGWQEESSSGSVLLCSFTPRAVWEQLVHPWC